MNRLVLGACAALSLAACNPGSGATGDDEVGGSETGEEPPPPPCPEGQAPEDIGAWGPVIDYSDWQTHTICDEGQGADCEVGLSRPVAVHAVLLPTRRILFWRNAQAYLYDWELNQLEYVPANFTDVGVCHIGQNRTKFQCEDLISASDCFCPPNATEEECTSDDLSCQLIDYSSDIFCAGQTLLEDGRVLAVGGNNGGSYTEGGLRDALVFDPWTKALELRGGIAEGRWYPTATRMTDGRVFVIGGTNAGEVEVFDVQQPIGSEASVFTGDNANYPWTEDTEENHEGVQGVTYPFVFQLWDGSLFATGCEDCGDNVQWGGIVFRLSNEGEWLEANEKVATVRGSSGVMYAPGKVMKASGGHELVEVNSELLQEPYEKTEMIDLAGDDYLTEAQYVDGGDMNHPRHFSNFTLLADGTVAAIGGTSGSNGNYGQCGGDGANCYPPGDEWVEYSGWSQARVDACGQSFCQVDPDAPAGTVPLQCEDDRICSFFPGQHSPPCLPEEGECIIADYEEFATRTTEIWTPEHRQWCDMAVQGEARMYHSTSLLLPDGRVISMGSGARQGLFDKMNAEIYSPPYLFKDGGSRPEISSPADLEELELGQELLIELDAEAPNGSDISKIAFVALGATTHQFDMNQRYVPVENWTVEGNNVRITVEEDEDVLIPGYYMLFVLSEAGVPSEAPLLKIVRSG